MEKSSDIELRLLIEAIYLKYSYDFRDYSGASVKRRVAHALRQFDCATISTLASTPSPRPRPTWRRAASSFAKRCWTPWQARGTLCACHGFR